VTQPISAIFIAFRLPLLSPTNSLVVMAQCLSQPSSCEEEVRSISGQFGQGVVPSLSAGGLGISSICVTDKAPCLLDVPTQSEPVSPPPITITFLPVASISPF